MSDRRKRIWGQLLDELDKYSDDELLADLFRAKRMNTARVNYGDFVAALDDRNFNKEAAEEIADFISYVGMHLVAREARRQERVACFKQDEIVAGLTELEEATRGA